MFFGLPEDAFLEKSWLRRCPWDSDNRNVDKWSKRIGKKVSEITPNSSRTSKHLPSAQRRASLKLTKLIKPRLSHGIFDHIGLKVVWLELIKKKNRFYRKLVKMINVRPNSNENNNGHASIFINEYHVRFGWLRDLKFVRLAVRIITFDTTWRQL